jgi:hypothetical protein
MAMNTRQISAFRLSMRLGSMTAAAKALHISQPAVSRLIVELERQLGFPLFRIVDSLSAARFRPPLTILPFRPQFASIFTWSSRSIPPPRDRPSSSVTICCRY